MKVLVYGMDGATWRVIRPMLEKGKMNTLRSLMDRGSYGVLKSIEPMISPMLWTTISSGKVPEKHGVKDFVIPSDAVKTRRIWDILEKYGKTVGIFGHMVTWPPRPIRHFMIPDVFARGPETYPPEYQFIREMAVAEAARARSLRKYLGYVAQGLRNGFRWSSLWAAARYMVEEKIRRYGYLDTYYRKRLLKLRFQTDLFVHLIRKYSPDYLFFYSNVTDACAHLYWKFHEPQLFPEVTQEEIRRYGHVLETVYEASDRALGQILKALGPDTNVIVLSDHGFQPVPQMEDTKTYVVKSEALLKALGVADQVRYVVISDRTYIRSLHEDTAFEDQLMERIRRIQVHGVPLFITKRDKVGYVLVTVNNREASPHIRLDETVDIEGKSVPLGKLLSESDTRISGEHHPDGILVVAGPAFKSGVLVENATVLDITPTVLALFGIPIGRDMDGKPLTALLQDTVAQGISYVDTHDEGYTYSGEEGEYTEELKEHLRGLGYL